MRSRATTRLSWPARISYWLKKTNSSNSYNSMSKQALRDTARNKVCLTNQNSTLVGGGVYSYHLVFLTLQFYSYVYQSWSVGIPKFLISFVSLVEPRTDDTGHYKETACYVQPTYTRTMCSIFFGGLFVFFFDHHDVCTGDGSGIAQQLDFGVGDGGERLVELAAQVEDLTYQLSTTHEELQAAIERAEQAEVRILVICM